MFYRIRRNIELQWFNRQTQGILSTPAITSDPASGFVLLMQLCERDFLMGLVALKSFMRFRAPKRLVVLNDGSLSHASLALLSKTFPGAVQEMVSDYRIDGLPIGICWERLACIEKLIRSDYTIQLDSDTVTREIPAEIDGLIAANRSFTMPGDAASVKIETMLETWERMKNSTTQHVQVLAEQAFRTFPQFTSLRYVRGCAGFAGYARNSFTLEAMVGFSHHMESELGTRWHTWGSDQVASNYLVANSQDAVVLPHARYSTATANLDPHSRALLHFLGTRRFTGGEYRRQAQAVIEQLRGTA
jgi:peptidoglycan/xylan/chitin deacetylase (PgdA/CDA1 family)